MASNYHDHHHYCYYYSIMVVVWCFVVPWCLNENIEVDKEKEKAST